MNSKNTYFFFAGCLIFNLVSFGSPYQQHRCQKTDDKTLKTTYQKPVIEGASRLETYLPLLRDKRIAVVANQASVLRKKRLEDQKPRYTHLVDSLRSLNINIVKIFAPEHGFRGTADAGAVVKDTIDPKTGIPIISLYGKNKKPEVDALENIDLILFDIQDTGVRFYTYIATLHYLMEACAEQQIPLVVLDRPNPNGHYIDGPVLRQAFRSFVGMHPVPVVYGMTIGEYARMINGEKWLANGVCCDITVIPCEHYNRDATYSLPVKPSPNLPNDEAVRLYPSLCFFEGTTISVGRGTSLPFECYGAPWMKKTAFRFTPQPNEGAKHPKYQNELCYGVNLRGYSRHFKQLRRVNLQWLINAYRQASAKNVVFWNDFFQKLAGTDILRKQIEEGASETAIRESWQKDIEAFKQIRAKYLIYP